jgi:mannose-1-phosphate guanylyltransferase
MKALILAGGLGTRLRPLTYTRPKHLLPIVNRPHIEHVFDLLGHFGIEQIVLLTSYLAQTFESTVERAAGRGIHIDVTHEPQPLGTAGALKNALDFVSDGTFLAFNGDVLTDVDLARVIAFHRDREAEATILLTPVSDPSAYGVVPTDGHGRVAGFIEKPPREEAPTNLINAGVYVLEPTVLDRIPEERVWSAERDLFPGLVQEGARLYALGTDAYWIDIGTPDKYLQANLDALAGRYSTTVQPSGYGPGVVAGVGATVSPSARVASATLGPGAVVEEGAIVERSVLLGRSRVATGAVVMDSILGEGAEVPMGARVKGAVLADGEVAGEEG